MAGIPENLQACPGDTPPPTRLHPLNLSLSYHSTAVKKHQGSSEEKVFNWGLVYSFRGLVHAHHGRECSGRQAGMVPEELRAYILIDRWEAEKSARLSLEWAFETLQPTPSDTLPATRPHFSDHSQTVLIFQTYKLMGVHSHSNYHSVGIHYSLQRPSGHED